VTLGFSAYAVAQVDKIMMMTLMTLTTTTTTVWVINKQTNIKAASEEFV
jgi:hypothetical protein